MLSVSTIIFFRNVVDVESKGALSATLYALFMHVVNARKGNSALPRSVPPEVLAARLSATNSASVSAQPSAAGSLANSRNASRETLSNESEVISELEKEIAIAKQSLLSRSTNLREHGDKLEEMIQWMESNLPRLNPLTIEDLETMNKDLLLELEAGSAMLSREKSTAI
jgi:hypothetical protein